MSEQLDTSMSLGGLLRQAREARNLSPTAVAAQLHLSPRIIELLEADQYEESPGVMFLKGYLRNYSKFLRLDENQVTHAFARLNINPVAQRNEPSKLLRLSNTPLKVRRRFRVGKLGFSVLSILIIFFVLWWYAHQGSSNNSVQQIGNVQGNVVATLSLNNAADSDAVSTAVPATPVAPTPTTSQDNTKVADAKASSTHSKPLAAQLHMDLG